APLVAAQPAAADVKAEPAPVVAASAVVPLLDPPSLSSSQRIEPVIEPLTEPASEPVVEAPVIAAPAAVPVAPVARLAP
ncbi:hypothetical protein ACMWQU_27140, partial [Escherichia coli]